MSTTGQPFDSDADLLAAEYVLGVLDADMRRTVQARIGRDAAFADEVAAWEARFAPWLEQIVPVPAPLALWPRILSETGADPAEAHDGGMRRNVVARPSLWDRLPFWRGLAAGGFAVAAASLAALFITLSTVPQDVQQPSVPPKIVTVPAPATMPMVVSLRHDDGTMAYTATVDAKTGVITLIPAFMPDDERVPELWMIDAGGVPHSLGVVARDHAMRVVMPEQFRSQTAPDTVFAVSMEPLGGSPTGQPTGPVVAKGSLVRL